MALKGLVSRGMEGAMGSSGRGSDAASKSQPDAEARVAMTQAPAPRTVAPSTSVDAGSELEGRLRCSQTLRIDGRIVGEIECDKAVIIGQGGRVHACIDADDVQVAGLVEGDIVARRKVTLERTAVVVGDLTTPGIVIEEGAKLKGRILIGSDTEAEQRVAEAKASKKEEPATVPAEASASAGERQSDAAPPSKDGKKASTPVKGRAGTSKAEPVAAASA